MGKDEKQFFLINKQFSFKDFFFLELLMGIKRDNSKFEIKLKWWIKKGGEKRILGVGKNGIVCSKR